MVLSWELRVHAHACQRVAAACMCRTLSLGLGGSGSKHRAGSPIRSRRLASKCTLSMPVPVHASQSGPFHCLVCYTAFDMHACKQQPSVAPFQSSTRTARGCQPRASPCRAVQAARRPRLKALSGTGAAARARRRQLIVLPHEQQAQVVSARCRPRCGPKKRSCGEAAPAAAVASSMRCGLACVANAQRCHRLSAGRSHSRLCHLPYT